MGTERAGEVRAGWDFKHPSLIAACEVIARVFVTPLLFAHGLRLVSFKTGGEMLSLVPGAVGLLLRRAWYGATLERCGARLHVGIGTVIKFRDTRIGDDCVIGIYNHVARASIGDNFLSAGHVTILSGRAQHGFMRRDIPIRAQPGTRAPVVIGEDVWAGAHAAITADVAAHTVVAAGAVVTKTFPEWSILGGVPATLIRERP